MQTVNRAVVLLRPRQPYVDWVRGGFVLGGAPELARIRTPVYAYLVPVVDYEEDRERVLEDHYAAMFENELEAWVTDTESWPPDRDLRLFREWFDVDFVETALDVCDEDLPTDDEDALG